MKHILLRSLMFTLATILLSACANSKEDDADTNNKTSYPITRSVAQDYLVNTHQQTDKETYVECLPTVFPKSSEKKSQAITVKNQQAVSLVPGGKAAIEVDGIHWLHVLPNEGSKQSCYIQTIYLEPMPIY